MNPAPQPSARLEFIDGLRGIAMLMVMLCHCWLAGRWHVRLPLGHRWIDVAILSTYGRVGVNLFLVLSGFCLYWPLVKSSARREPTLWEFFQRRCRRILPPYYAALLLYAGLSLFQGHGQYPLPYLAKWLAWHALMLHNLRPEYVLRINPAFWSLALEFQLYLLFPLLIVASRRLPIRAVVLVCFLGSTAFRLLVAPFDYADNRDDLFTLPFSVFGRCFEFSLGMLMAHIVAGRSSFRRLDMLFAGVVALLFVREFPRGQHLEGTDAIFGTPFCDAFWGLLFALLLFLASRSGAWLHRALSARWLVFLGTISYSIYLIHQPLVDRLQGVADRFPLSNPEKIAFQLFLAVPLILAVSYVFHLLFERPFMPGRPRTEAEAAKAAVVSPAP